MTKFFLKKYKALYRGKKGVMGGDISPLETTVEAMRYVEKQKCSIDVH